MLTDYEIKKLSLAIVNNLVNDEKFIRRIAKSMSENNRKLVNSRRAAEILGINQKAVREIAPFLNGIKGGGKYAHWLFEEKELIERYKAYKNRN